jgi:hypothetical protein
LRMRVNMSAIGSDTVIGQNLVFFGLRLRRLRLRRLRLRRLRLRRLRLPARFFHTRKLAPQGKFPKTDTTQLKAPNVPSRSAAPPAAISHPHLVLALPLSYNHTFLRHTDSFSPGYCLRRNGIPNNASNSRPSSSVRAVVTMLTSIPRILSIESYTISGNTSCSRNPSV